MGATVEHKDKSYTFENLLEKEKGFVFNVMFEIYKFLTKILNGIAPEIISSILKLSNSTHNLTNTINFVSGHAKNVTVLPVSKIMEKNIKNLRT